MSSPRHLAGAPVAGENTALGMIGAISSGSDRPIRLLVIDDDPRVLAAIAQTIALEPDLVIVAEAADATTAQALADSADPSVALVDVLLPDDLTGLALVNSLHQRPRCSVVAMSVRGGLRDAALAAGAAAFVEKGATLTPSLTPFGPPQLRRARDRPAS